MPQRKQQSIPSRLSEETRSTIECFICGKPSSQPLAPNEEFCKDCLHRSGDRLEEIATYLDGVSTWKWMAPFLRNLVRSFAEDSGVSEQVERFWQPIGPWVLYSDYEKLKAKIGEQRAYIDLLVKVGEGSEDTADKFQAERDQAAQQERERLRKELNGEAIRKVAAKRLRLTDEAVGIAGMPRPSYENTAGAILVAVSDALNTSKGSDEH